MGLYWSLVDGWMDGLIDGFAHVSWENRCLSSTHFLNSLHLITHTHTRASGEMARSHPSYMRQRLNIDGP